MIIVLLGASGSGKSTIENELAMHYGYMKQAFEQGLKDILIDVESKNLTLMMQVKSLKELIGILGCF